MTAPYAAPYSDEEFEKLLQDVNDFPSSIDNPGLGLDFSALPSIDDIDTMTSLCELPPPPPLNNDCSSNSDASFEDDDIRVHQHHMQKQIDCLETEVDYLRSLVDQLTTYLTNLRPWMMEVTEALDKLGEAPASATELEFNMD